VCDPRMAGMNYGKRLRQALPPMTLLASEAEALEWLEQLAAEPLVLYHSTVTGRTRIDNAFNRARLKLNVALEAIDSDVIKTYVKLGMGVGIVAELAVRDDLPGSELVSRPLGHLFGANVTRVAFKRGAYLRHFVYAFAEQLSDRLSQNLIQRAMQGTGTDFEM